MSNLVHETLLAKIDQKLHEHPKLSSYALKTRVYENGTVQIQGIVDVLEEKIQAEGLLWNIPGVKRIENDITVCTDGEINDLDVAFEVAEEFQANPEVPPTVGVRVTGGEVQLLGRVNNFNQAQEALETAAKARGVREVVSRLKLNDSYDDASLNNLVQATLMAEPEVPLGRIKSIAHHGVVSLFGKLTEAQAMIALDAISKIPGIKHIHNLINQPTTDPDSQILQIDNQLRLED
jgi:hyperosmotically inducible protein